MKEHDDKPCDLEEFGDCICTDEEGMTVEYIGEGMPVGLTPVEPTAVEYTVEPTPVEPTPVRLTPVEHTEEVFGRWDKLSEKEKIICQSALLASADTLDHAGYDGGHLLRRIAEQIQEIG